MSGRKGMVHYRVETKQKAVRLVLEEHRTAGDPQIGEDRSLGPHVSPGGRVVLSQANRTSTEDRNREERVGTLANGERLAKKIPYRIARHAARTAQYRAIYHFREEFAVNAMCEFFAVSRAAYYEWVKKLEEPDPDLERLEQVQAVYQTSHRTYGYRRITLDLQQNRGICINHKTVLRLTLAPGASAGVRKLNIRSVARKPKVHKKREETGIYHKYPNLLNRDFAASHPNQKWVTDVTYIRTQQGWAYLSTIKDLYAGFIVGHAFSQSNSIALVTAALRQAQQTEKVTDGLILHSDQGHQYTSQAYHDVLTQEYNITPSMSRRGNCWDNAPMENFFGHLKEEYLRQFHKPTFQEAQLLIDEYIHFYNYQRIQLKTRQTPYQRRCLSY